MFPKRLKELRKLRKIKQKDCAYILNINRSTYAGYETGKTKPSYEVLIKLADYFNVSLDYLTGREELTPNQEFAALLSDPEMQAAFKDYNNWTYEDKKELLVYLKTKRTMRERKLL